MTTNEQLDLLHAQVLAIRIAVKVLADHADPEVRSTLEFSAGRIAELGLPWSMSDEQLEQIKQTLLMIARD